MTITIIIVIAVLLLLAYIFDLTSSFTRIPSVILLLFLGWGCRVIVDFFSIKIPDLNPLLPIFGTLGLILIVLEGALELDFNKTKLKLIGKTFSASIISIFTLAFIISYAFQYYSGAGFYQCLINALPVSTISSSVAISSARNLDAVNKEYVMYESSLSDILGVLIFNFVLTNNNYNLHAFGQFGIQMVIICIISLISTLLLAVLLSKIDHPIKHAPIIILLILIYGIAEIFHLPALLFVLFFGIFLGNIDELRDWKFIKKLKPYEFNKELVTFKDIVTEGTFLIRAFFFTLFGYSFQTREIINPETIQLAIICFAAIVIIRAIILLILRQKLIPLLFMAPRGLITILLFFAIPASMGIGVVNKSLIVQVIILTTVFMMIGLMIKSKETPKEVSSEKKEMILGE